MPYADPARNQACKAAYHLAHREEERAYQHLHKAAKYREYADWLHNLNQRYTCDSCGGDVELWHHIVPSTKWFTIGGGMGYSADSMKTELAKCVPMCRPCHSRLHDSLHSNEPLDKPL